MRWARDQHLAAGLTLDGAVEAVQAGLAQGIELVHAEGHEIRVGQLVTAMRHADRGLEIAELALRHRDAGVVGFDIAGAEAGFPASRHRVAFDHLARQCFPVTVHAGEADGLESIRSALFDGRALRLGHGVRLAEDLRLEDEDDDNTYVTVGRLARWVRDRQIALEVSPQSNLQTGAIERWGDELADHPFDLLYQLGFRVTVNTDNRLMSGCTMTSEMLDLAATFSYGWADLQWFTVNAMKSAFIGFAERLALINDVIKPRYAELIG